MKEAPPTSRSQTEKRRGAFTRVSNIRLDCLNVLDPKATLVRGLVIDPFRENLSFHAAGKGGGERGHGSDFSYMMRVYRYEIET